MQLKRLATGLFYPAKLRRLLSGGGRQYKAASNSGSRGSSSGQSDLNLAAPPSLDVSGVEAAPAGAAAACDCPRRAAEAAADQTAPPLAPAWPVALAAAARTASIVSSDSDESEDSTAFYLCEEERMDMDARCPAQGNLSREASQVESAATSTCSMASSATCGSQDSEAACGSAAGSSADAGCTSTSGSAAEQQAAATAACAELACVLAPLLGPVQRRAALAGATIQRIVQLIEEQAEWADGRALLELLATCAKEARLSAALRAATLPAAAALLGEATTRVPGTTHGRLQLHRRVSRAAALRMHGIAEDAWRWRPAGGDGRHAAELKAAGSRYLRSLRNYFFSDLQGWSKIQFHTSG